MLPVTRANLDHICCICLLDIRPSVYTQMVYDVGKEQNISKVLKLTAHITILKNPINQKYISDYCRKICETCFIKIQYSFTLREKIVASTVALKELLQNGLSKLDIKKLKLFCRICLNFSKDIKRLETMHMNWLKECSGIRFTSFIDKEVFRIKEGTNINEIAVIDDRHFPQNLCQCCFKKLKNIEEFRKSATQSFEYMISVMGDTISQEDHLVNLKIKNFKENIGLLNSKQNERNAEIVNINCEKQEKSVKDLFQNQNFNCDMEPLINADDFINMQQFENGAMEFMDSIYHYSDSSEDGINSNIYFSDCSKSDNDGLREARIKISEQNKINENVSKSGKEENIETDILIEGSNTPIVIERSNNSKKKIRCYTERHRSLRNQNENKKKVEINIFKNAESDKAKQTIACEECSKEFSSKRALRKHKGTVHNFDSAKMNECLICLKKFKRKSHMDDHIKSVHEKLKPFKCSYCAKTFTTNSTKRVHELGHTGEFPFVCNFCGKGFRRSNQLKIHSDIHTSIPELLCPICKRSQTSKTDLENHLKIHSDKRVQCPLCGKIFSRNSHLIDHHNAVHLKLRPFKCKYCELAFGDRKTRRSHEKLHTEDRPLKCSICSMGFKNQFGLTRHIKEIGHIPEQS